MFFTETIWEELKDWRRLAFDFIYIYTAVKLFLYVRKICRKLNGRIFEKHPSDRYLDTVRHSYDDGPVGVVHPPLRGIPLVNGFDYLLDHNGVRPMEENERYHNHLDRLDGRNVNWFEF